MSVYQISKIHIVYEAMNAEKMHLTCDAGQSDSVAMKLKLDHFPNRHMKNA